MKKLLTTLDLFALLPELQDCLSGNPDKWLHGKRYLHVDNGADILAVAHLDTVLQTDHYQIQWWNKRIINCPQLDDRIGLFVILHVLPYLGIHTDILLTTDEEIGQSTASDFADDFKDGNGKFYNWGYEFDRRGTGAVLYDYEDSEHWERSIRESFDVFQGTFSDISCLDSIGCCFANFGVGYHEEHTLRCFLEIDELVNQVNKFVEFYANNKDTSFSYLPSVRTSGVSNWLYRDADQYDGYSCRFCNEEIDEGYLCEDCQLWAIEELDYMVLRKDSIYYDN
jgi:hypothetical protein